MLSYAMTVVSTALSMALVAPRTNVLTAPAAVVGAFVPSGGALQAAATFRGTASAAAEKAAFTHGYAFWHASKRQVEILFLTRTLTPKEQKDALEESLLSSSLGHSAWVTLGLAQGATKLDAASVEWTTLVLNGFVESPFSNNVPASELGLAALSGEARTGGPIKAAIKGQTTIKGGGPSPIAYAWQLDVTATLSAH
jgi:hypothetical protein